MPFRKTPASAWSGSFPDINWRRSSRTARSRSSWARSLSVNEEVLAGCPSNASSAALHRQASTTTEVQHRVLIMTPMLMTDRLGSRSVVALAIIGLLCWLVRDGRQGDGRNYQPEAIHGSRVFG